MQQVSIDPKSALEALERRLADTPADRRPGGALVISSGAFVAPGCRAYGTAGLYGLAIVMTNLLRAVSSAETDLGAYIAAHVE